MASGFCVQGLEQSLPLESPSKQGSIGTLRATFRVVDAQNA